MERARNSDSETHVKKYNWTSGTYLSLKSLWDIFFRAPCTFVVVNLSQRNRHRQPMLSVPRWQILSSTLICFSSQDCKYFRQLRLIDQRLLWALASADLIDCLHCKDLSCMPTLKRLICCDICFATNKDVCLFLQNTFLSWMFDLY